MTDVIEVVQTPFELDRMLDLARGAHPKRILEVGSWDGGTLREWMAIASERVVAIDREPRVNPDIWNEWSVHFNVEFHVIVAESAHESTITTAERLGPYDWVFIDADHDARAVRADWRNYSPMVAPGGAVAFHDILPRPDYGVNDLWNEIKAEPGARWVEITQTPNEPGMWGGIGAVWLP